MKHSVLALSLFFLANIYAQNTETLPDRTDYWPQWRGPRANGSAPFAHPPLEWSETRNIKWKIDLPGKGSSSPIVWGDYVFVTAALPSGSGDVNGPQQEADSGGTSISNPVQKFVVLALNREDGKMLWQKTVRQEAPHEGTHPTGTFASNSPVTDGQHVYAYFGSRGLYCLDLQGNLVWERDFGDMRKLRAFGEGSSPVLYDEKILILWDHEGPSFLFALDKKTGKEIWTVSRDEVTSWSTPLVVDSGGLRQVITSATNRIRSYNLDDGSLIWECSGMTRNVIPSPVTIDDIVIMMSGFRGSSLLAVRLGDTKGEISESDSILWKLDRDTPYTPSPLLYDETLYFLKSNNGILSSYHAKTGEQFYGPQRLEGLGSVYSSPVGAAGRVYISDREGNTLVIRHGREFEILTTNTLEDGFDASPAIVDDQIYMRGHEHFYCIAHQ
jgi:outer membrane protein assembly factor BamB